MYFDKYEELLRGTIRGTIRRTKDQINKSDVIVFRQIRGTITRNYYEELLRGTIRRTKDQINKSNVIVFQQIRGTKDQIKQGF